MLPSPSEIVYFLEVASTLNISRAAERLGITQPTLSLAIQRLEDTVGAALLIRNRSGVKLTHTGEKFLGKAQDLLDKWESVRNETLKSEKEISGRYVLGCHPSVALYSLPVFLPVLLEEQPKLEIKLVHDLSRKITEDVISFKIDIGIVVNPWPHPDLVIRPLFRDEVTLWTASGKSVHQDPTSGKTMLICDPDLLQTQSIVKQLEKKGFPFPRVFTSSSLEVISALVAAEAGVGILPGRVAARIPGLRLFSKDAPKFQDKIALIFRADRQNSSASRSLVRWLEQKLTSESRLDC